MRTARYCTASALITSVAVEWGEPFARVLGIPAPVIVYGVPGIALFLALHFSVGRGVSAGWQVFGAAAIVAGWYLAVTTGADVYDLVRGRSKLFVAGACAGAIGGVSVALAMLPHRPPRLPAFFLHLALLGAVIGCIGLPLGFLFDLEAGRDGDYLFLLFVPWQVAMGLFVAGGRLSKPSA